MRKKDIDELVRLLIEKKWNGKNGREAADCLKIELTDSQCERLYKRYGYVIKEMPRDYKNFSIFL